MRTEQHSLPSQGVLTPRLGREEGSRGTVPDKDFKLTLKKKITGNITGCQDNWQRRAAA